MDHNVIETLSGGITRVIQQKGVDIVKDKRLFLACLKDECPDLDNKTKNVLNVALEYDAFDRIQKTSKNQIEATIISLASKMSDEYGLDLNLSENVVDAIAYYYGKSSGNLFTEKKEPEQSQPQVVQQTPAQPQPQTKIESTQDKQQQPPIPTRQTSVPPPSQGTSQNVTQQGAGRSLAYIIVASLITFGFGILAIFYFVTAVKGEPVVFGLLGKYVSELSMAATGKIVSVLAMVTMAIRSCIMFNRASKRNRTTKHLGKNGITTYELILWIISLLDIGILFVAARLHSCGVTEIIGIAGIFLVVLVGGWRYFKAVFSCGQRKSGAKVKAIVRVIFLIVSSLFTFGLIALDVWMICAISNEEILLFFESDIGVLLKKFARNAIFFMIARAVVMWIVGCQYSDENENTTYGLILGSLSILGIGGFFFAVTHVPYIDTWQYVVIVAAFLFVVIEKRCFFHNAKRWQYGKIATWWEYSNKAIVIAIVLSALFVLYIIIASCIPCFEKTNYSDSFFIWNSILAVFDIVWGLLRAVITIEQLVIGKGYWTSEPEWFNQYWIAGPWLNTIFYMLVATWIILAIVNSDK